MGNQPALWKIESDGLRRAASLFAHETTWRLVANQKRDCRRPSVRVMTVGLFVAAGLGLAVLLHRRRRQTLLAELAPAVPAAQLEPSDFEEANTDDRLLRRIETVLQRRTARVVMVLERLNDGHNYAAVLRTCESLGIQHVVLIAPPDRDDLFENRVADRRAADAAYLERDRLREANRKPGDPPPVPDSRKSLRRLKRRELATAFDGGDVLADAEHASAARNAERFLSIRTYASTAECLAALRAEGRSVWCTDLGQEAVILAPGAPWLQAPDALPDRLALCIGTESTGASRELLAAADRRVYLPQSGFADSLNASVAAALTLQTVLQLYGQRACGDFASEASDAELRALRLRWVRHFSRDEAHYETMAARVRRRARFLIQIGEVDSRWRALCWQVHAGEMPPPLHDMRRAEAFRPHMGRPVPSERRRARREEAARSAHPKLS